MNRATSMLSLTLAVVLAVPAVGVAQYHATDLICGSSSIQRINALGTVTTLFDNPGAVNSLTMDLDNRHLVFGDGGVAFGINGIVRLDPATNTVTTLVQNGSLLYHPLNLVMNYEGDYVFTNRYQNFVTPTFVTFQIGLFKLSRTTNAITTLLTTQQLGVAGNWSGGLGIDIDDGDYVIQDRNLLLGAPMLEVTEVGAVRTLGVGFSPRFGIAQDFRSGAWYSAAGNNILELPWPGLTPRPVFGARTGALFSGLTFDRQSDPTPRLVSADSRGVYHITPFTSTLTTTALSSAIPTPWALTYDGSRNLASERVGPGRYDFHVSFRGEGGNGYLVALSLAGVRPSVVLRDGREIHLSFDALAFLTLANLLPGIWSPGPGQLDAAGEATATLDTSGLGTLGVPCWAVALTLDAGGAGTISDPIVFRL